MIATRQSPLALAQAMQVRDALQAFVPERPVELLPMVTTGDRFVQQKLSAIGGKGLFTKEIEEALLSGQAQVAVHSLKDMETVMHPELVLASMPLREDARDVLISADGARSLSELPQGCTLGTASLRRAAQALRARPDLKIVPLRGNVQTRLAKIHAGEAQATLLALAGLKRLGMQPLPGHALSVEEMLPAVGQGLLGLQCREDDADTRALLARLNHGESWYAGTAERACLRALDGSCRTPIAAYAVVVDGALHLRAMRLSEDGAFVHHAEVRGDAEDAEALGIEAAEKIQADN